MTLPDRSVVGSVDHPSSDLDVWAANYQLSVRRELRRFGLWVLAAVFGGLLVAALEVAVIVRLD